MPATHDTKELFLKSEYDDNDMKEEVKLRLQMDAITSKYSSNGNQWELVTTWNVHGQQ